MEFYGSDGGNSGNDDFREYRRLILNELKRLGREQEVFAARAEGQITALRDTFTLKFDLLQKQISDLQAEVKAGERERKALSSVWGFVGGAVPVVMWFVYLAISSM